MAIKIRNWDVTEGLRTPEEIVAYLNAVVEENDPALLQAALGDVAKAVGMTEIARRSGLGRESLYKSLTANSAVSFNTMARVVEALGAKLVFAVG